MGLCGGHAWLHLGDFIELNQPVWAARMAFVTEPIEANAMQLDPHIEDAYGANWEFEYRYAVQTHPGKARLLSYLNRAHMGSYSETLSNPAFNEDVTQTRAYRFKYGFGLNLKQELNSSLGVFMRAGWNDGATETWNFTEVDRTITAGLSQKGTPWNRDADTVGLALISNWLSPDHAHYLAAGGLGFLLGDGALNYAPEQILEAYDSVPGRTLLFRDRGLPMGQSSWLQRGSRTGVRLCVALARGTLSESLEEKSHSHQREGDGRDLLKFYRIDHFFGVRSDHDRYRRHHPKRENSRDQNRHWASIPGFKRRGRKLGQIPPLGEKDHDERTSHGFPEFRAIAFERLFFFFLRFFPQPHRDREKQKNATRADSNGILRQKCQDASEANRDD